MQSQSKNISKHLHCYSKIVLSSLLLLTLLKLRDVLKNITAVLDTLQQNKTHHTINKLCSKSLYSLFLL